MNPRRLIVALYLLLFVAVGLGSATFFLKTRERYLRLRGTEEKNRRELAGLEARVKAQEQFLRRLREDPVLVEKVIRQRLGYARPDEDIFRFKE